MELLRIFLTCPMCGSHNWERVSRGAIPADDKFRCYACESEYTKGDMDITVREAPKDR